MTTATHHTPPSQSDAPHSGEPAIAITNLVKTYANGLNALKSVTFSVNTGDFFALLGPNGAGKSTTIGIISGLVTPTSGNIIINGVDLRKNPSEAKSHLGIVPQEFNFNIFEPCNQIMINQAGYYGVPRKTAISRTHELFEQLELTDKLKSGAGTLSGGLKRRLMIARALIHQPKILILDEPTAGVDIALRHSMWSFLKRKNEEGLTIILTTHYLEEAEQLCKKIAIINQGELAANTDMQTLLDQLNSETFILFCNTLPDTLPTLDGVQLHRRDRQSIEVELPKSQSISHVVDHLKQHAINVARIQTKTNRLESLFLKMVAKPS